jgi:type III restriction enzyme
MSNPFFDRPIVNSPYEYPQQHWELDETGQPTGRLIDKRRRAEFITPIPKPKKRRGTWPSGTVRESWRPSTSVARRHFR